MLCATFDTFQWWKTDLVFWAKRGWCYEWKSKDYIDHLKLFSYIWSQFTSGVRSLYGTVQYRVKTSIGYLGEFVIQLTMKGELPIVGLEMNKIIALIRRKSLACVVNHLPHATIWMTIMPNPNPIFNTIDKKTNEPL